MHLDQGSPAWDGTMGSGLEERWQGPWATSRNISRLVIKTCRRFLCVMKTFSCSQLSACFSSFKMVSGEEGTYLQLAELWCRRDILGACSAVTFWLECLLIAFSLEFLSSLPGRVRGVHYSDPSSRGDSGKRSDGKLY